MQICKICHGVMFISSGIVFFGPIVTKLHRNDPYRMCRCRGWNSLSHLTSPGLFVNDFLLARQIQVLAQAGENFCVHPGKLRLTFSYFAFFFATVISWSPSGPSNFHLLLVDLKNCVRLCWLMISWFSIFSVVTVTFTESPWVCRRSKYRQPDWA